MSFRPQIAIDVDSTLYDFEQIARDAFLHLARDQDDKSLFRGAYHPWNEWRNPHDVCGKETWGEVCKLAISECFPIQPPYPGAVEVVNALSEYYSPLYISSRLPSHYEGTMKWLDDNDFPRGEILCEPGDKILHLQGIRYLIDDRPKWLVEFIHDYAWKTLRPHEPRLAFGLHFPYNCALTDIDNIFLAPTWRGLQHYLVEAEVLPKESAPLQGVV